jgi:hypothetical protein
LSIAICSPVTASVSSVELGEALVVSWIEARSSEIPVPLLIRSTARWTVSPATRLEAPTVRRLAAPTTPRSIETVPDAIDWLADVELVNVANVPRPAMLAVAPSAAKEPRSFMRVVRFIVDSFREGPLVLITF